MIKSFASASFTPEMELVNIPGGSKLYISSSSELDIASVAEVVISGTNTSDISITETLQLDGLNNVYTSNLFKTVLYVRLVNLSGPPTGAITVNILRDGAAGVSNLILNDNPKHGDVLTIGLNRQNLSMKYKFISYAREVLIFNTLVGTSNT